MWTFRSSVLNPCTITFYRSIKIVLKSTLCKVFITNSTILLCKQCGHPLEVIGVLELGCGNFRLIWSGNCNFFSCSLSFLYLLREEVDGDKSLIGRSTVRENVFIGVV